MKQTSQKMFASVMAAAFLLSGVSLPASAATGSASLLDALSGSSAGTAVANAELKVKGLSALPDNESVQLLWEPVEFEGKKLTTYQILYGSKSVEEGLADSYDGGAVKVEADMATGIARYTMTKLKNGEKYFFTVKAIKPDGKPSDMSADEVSATPSSTASAQKPETATTAETLSLKTVNALTKNFVKVEFSKMVALPKDLKAEEEKTLFRIVKKGEKESTDIEIKDVIFRSNYFLSENDLATKSVTKDTVVYIQVADLEKDSQYEITVNAGIKGEDGKPITSGSTDSSPFVGTDLTAIPETEKTEAQNIKTEATSTDPLAAMFLNGTEEKKDENLKAAPAEDKLSPEEIEALKIEAKERAKDFLLTLSWKKSKNTAGDLLKQILYVSQDTAETKKWEKLKELNGDITTVPFTAKPDTEYYFKITTVDKAGNESAGVIQKYKVPALVATGAPMFLTLGLALMGGAFWTLQRRRFFS